MKYTKRTSLALALLLAGLSLASCGQQANKSQLKTPAKTSVKTTQNTTVKTTAKTTEKTTATSQKATETKKTEAKKTEKKTEARKSEAKKTQAQQAEDTYEVWTPAEEEEPVRVQAPARTEAPAPARTQAPKPVQTEAPAPPPTEAPAPPPTEALKPAIPEGFEIVDGYLIRHSPNVVKRFWFADYGGEAAAEEACRQWIESQPYEWDEGYSSVGYATTIDYYTDRPAGWGVYMIP